jgi:hydrogenase expression/formation protein HypC
MCIVEINGFVARCEAKGIERDVSLFMLQDDGIAVGDFVMVHVGYAIQKVSAADAQTSWELFDEAFGLNETLDEGAARHV